MTEQGTREDELRILEQEAVSNLDSCSREVLVRNARVLIADARRLREALIEIRAMARSKEHPPATLLKAIWADAEYALEGVRP